MFRRRLMWNRFTKPTTQAIFFACAEAQRLGTSEVGPDHLLLGLLRENDHVAARVLRRLGISRRRLRIKVERQVQQASHLSDPEMRIGLSGRRAVTLSFEEACQVNRGDSIGTEHLLLGLMRAEEGVAGRVLTQLGADPERIRALSTQIATAVPEERFGACG
jgi:ATP-dependent Clp protease ATP-binding subunit ClpC